MTAVAAVAPTRRQFGRVLGGLTAVNLVVNVLTLVTGPLQARMLGPAGRGELALILAVTGFAPLVACLGLGTFLARDIGGSRERGSLLGTVAILSFLAGLVVALLALPLSLLVGPAGSDVQLMVMVGLLTLPIAMTGANLSGAYWGDESWGLLSATRLVPPLVIALGFVVLALADAFTVVTAALTVFAGGLVAVVPLAPLARSWRDWRFDRTVARRGVGFGARYNVSAIALQGALRVDQICIAAILGTHELGLYVVAFSLAAATTMASQALNLMVVPMVAAGGDAGVRRIHRLTLWTMAVVAAALALAAGPIIELLFGAPFGQSATLARILCLWAVFSAGKGIISAALVGHDHPGEPALVETVSLVVLVGLLLLVVPAGGAQAAAIAVVGCSAAGLAVLVWRACVRIGGTAAEYLVPSRDDLAWLRGSPAP